MSSLELQAADRKAKLAALRNKRKQDASELVESDAITKKLDTEKKKKLISRNFDPVTKSEIRGFDKPPSTLDENSETVEAVSQKIQDEVLAKFRKQIDIRKIGLTEKTVKPRSVTWDLQRDIQENLDLLQEKTDEAIKLLVKERIRKLKEQDKTVEA